MIKGCDSCFPSFFPWLFILFPSCDLSNNNNIINKEFCKLMDACCKLFTKIFIFPWLRLEFNMICTWMITVPLLYLRENLWNWKYHPFFWNVFDFLKSFCERESSLFSSGRHLWVWFSFSKWEISERHCVQCSFRGCQAVWVFLLWSSPIKLWWDESRHEL